MKHISSDSFSGFPNLASNCHFKIRVAICSKFCVEPFRNHTLKIFNPIILGVIFFLLITPFGIAGRLLGRDILLLRSKKTHSSWQTYNKQQGPFGTNFNLTLALSAWSFWVVSILYANLIDKN